MKHSILFTLALSLTVFSVTCAASFMGKADSVAITAVPKKVEGCKLLGQVQDDSASGGFQDRLTELRKQTVISKGNTLLMRSNLSNSGTAYLCTPPIKGDSEG